MLEEAVKRDYALNDIEALDLDEALDYIAFMPSANKYEALLNAIVKNRVLQMKAWVNPLFYQQKRAISPLLEIVP